LKTTLALITALVATACGSTPNNESTVKGYENTRRMLNSDGLKPVGDSEAFFVTGRLSMGLKDRNQCEAAYVDDEKVLVKYEEDGEKKIEPLYVTGVNNLSFFGAHDSSRDLNGKITAACGTVVEVNFDVKNGSTPIKMRFVVVDRIYEQHAQDRPNLDIAKQAYLELRKRLSHENNFDGMTVQTIAKGSYQYAQNNDCWFEPGNLNRCGDGW
jgi:hypothetical protein